MEQKLGLWNKFGKLLNYSFQIKTLQPSTTLSPTYLTLARHVQFCLLTTIPQAEGQEKGPFTVWANYRF